MNVVTVADPPALARLCERIECADRVALDTEFHSEKTYVPRLMVVQVALDDEVALVDPLALPDLNSLAHALRGRTVVGHALSSDLKIFYERFGILPTHVFDTQVAAAFCGYGLSISLLELVRDVTGVTLRKSQTVSDWSTRPLTPRQIDYLVDDVKFLLRLQDDLIKKLEQRGRLAWAIDECALLVEDRRYAVDRTRLFQRVAGAQKLSRRELAILSELAVFRESVARERDIPIKTVLANDLLLSIAQLKPRSPDELDELRRLSPSVKRQLGPRLVAAVAAGEAWPEDQLPTKGGRPLGAAREACVALLGVVVDGLASAAGLPSSLVVSRALLERVLRELPASRKDLIAILELTQWRADLVVDPIWDVLRGAARLSIEGYAAGSPRAKIDALTQQAEMPAVENEVPL